MAKDRKDKYSLAHINEACQEDGIELFLLIIMKDKEKNIPADVSKGKSALI